MADEGESGGKAPRESPESLRGGQPDRVGEADARAVAKLDSLSRNVRDLAGPPLGRDHGVNGSEPTPATGPPHTIVV